MCITIKSTMTTTTTTPTTVLLLISILSPCDNTQHLYCTNVMWIIHIKLFLYAHIFQYTVNQRMHEITYQVAYWENNVENPHRSTGKSTLIHIIFGLCQFFGLQTKKYPQPILNIFYFFTKLTYLVKKLTYLLNTDTLLRVMINKF